MTDFEELYKTHASKMLNYFVANGLDEHSAADVVQEAFLRLWKHKDSLHDDPAQVSGLLWTTARNIRTDRYRKLSRETLQDEIGEDEGGTAAAPEMPSDSAYLRRRIQAALATLPPTLREAYTMFQILELPVREIARRTNTTESNVKVRVFRAKEKLQPLLKDLI